LAGGNRIEDGFQVELSQRTKDGGDVAVRERTDDLKRVGEKRAGAEIAFEDLAEGLDLSGRPIGEVGEGAVSNFAILAKGLAQEDGRRGVAVGDGGHIHAYIIS